MQCLDLSRVLMAGALDVMCLDKTGTLTKPTLEFGGFQRVVRSGPNSEFFPVEEADSSETASQQHVDLPIFTIGMASCHTVTKLYDQKIEKNCFAEREDENALLNDTTDCRYVGNSVECEMVKHAFRAHAVDFRVRDNGDVGYHLAAGGDAVERKELFRTVQQFEFDQKIQLQSVVVEMPAGADVSAVLPAGEAIERRGVVASLARVLQNNQHRNHVVMQFSNEPMQCLKL